MGSLQSSCLGHRGDGGVSSVVTPDDAGDAGSTCLSASDARLLQFLHASSAFNTRHSGQVSLASHLLGTYGLLQLAGQAEAVCLAGGLHSIYGTNIFTRALLNSAGSGQRQRVRSLFGQQAEQLAFLFHSLNRPKGLEDPTVLALWNGHSPTSSAAAQQQSSVRLHDDELYALRLIEAANLVEQGGSLVRWPTIRSLWLQALADTQPALLALEPSPRVSPTTVSTAPSSSSNSLRSSEGDSSSSVALSDVASKQVVGSDAPTVFPSSAARQSLTRPPLFVHFLHFVCDGQHLPCQKVSSLSILDMASLHRSLMTAVDSRSNLQASSRRIELVKARAGQVNRRAEAQGKQNQPGSAGEVLELPFEGETMQRLYSNPPCRPRCSGLRASGCSAYELVLTCT